ncbi:MAG TPA: aminoglycoside phosphotransferase family protein [Rhizomicrobium sp.]|nr:aminoglycoside phosphotransferase family protein [Rhizomicrobium sp.]
MSQERVYSQRLGSISDAQFEAAVARLNLGHFIQARPTSHGLFGQNVFVHTSEGEFVLRGAPHWVKGIDETEFRPEDRWQFTKERYFAQQLHTHTAAPVPWPMLHDDRSDIFGWPYLVMPRMPGDCFTDSDILKHLEPDDRRAVAVSLGENLASMQKLTSPYAGDVSHTTMEFEPVREGAICWIARELSAFARQADNCGSLEPEDRLLIDATIDRAMSASANRANTYVHCDYKLNNLTVQRTGSRWHVSGLFDFHEARFSDGGVDLVRTVCSYLDTEPPLARVFVESYFGNISRDPALRELMPLFVLNDRMKFWDFFAKPGSRASWLDGKTFRSWAGPYLERMASLI